MSTWIGPVGSLVRFRAVSSLDAEPASRSSLMVTLAGVVKEQRGPRARRSWSVRLPSSTRAEEVAGLLALVDGLVGPPPWVWVDPWAAVTNLLTPAQSGLEAGTYSGGGSRLGAATATDGTWLPVALGSGSEILWPSPGVPIPPGDWVTGAVYVQGSSPTVSLRFVSGAGATVGTAAASIPSGTGLRRVTVSAVAPASAVRALLLVNSSSRTAGAQITLTRAAVPYAHGEGADKVTIDGLSRSTLLASPDRRLHGVSFTVRELG